MDQLPLDGLAETGLKSRLQLNGSDEQETLKAAHWRVQPRWVKVLSFVLGIPCIAYLWLHMGGDPFATLLGKASVIGFAFVALVQMLFVFRAYWRMDI